MKISIKKKDLLNWSIYLIIIFNILLFRWLNVTSFSNNILLLLIVLSILENVKSYSKSLIWIAFILIPVYMLINIRIVGGHYSIVFDNFRSILLPLLILLYFSNIIRQNPCLLKSMLKKSFGFFNFFIIINIPVILLQISGNYFFNNIVRSVSTNSIDPDLASGLFGVNGTPQLALFAAFVIIYNFYYIFDNQFNKNKKNFLIGYTVIIAIIYTVISLYNDNKFFYVIILIYTVIYHFINLKIKVKHEQRNIRFIVFMGRIIPFLFFIFIFIWIIYNFTQIGEDINQMIHDFQIGIEKTYLVQGSNERFGMISFILQDTMHRRLGYGIGYTQWTTPYTFGFVHYGQSDLGTFMCLGGIWFAIIIFIYVIQCIKHCIRDNWITLLLAVMILILSVYTQIFTVSTLMSNVMLYVSLCGIKYNIHEEQ